MPGGPWIPVHRVESGSSWIGQPNARYRCKRARWVNENEHVIWVTAFAPWNTGSNGRSQRSRLSGKGRKPSAGRMTTNDGHQSLPVIASRVLPVNSATPSNHPQKHRQRPADRQQVLLGHAPEHRADSFPGRRLHFVHPHIRGLCRPWASVGASRILNRGAGRTSPATGEVCD